MGLGDCADCENEWSGMTLIFNLGNWQKMGLLIIMEHH